MLTVADLRVVVGQTTVLDQVSFTLAAGEVLVVVGPNGAGKSTLIRAVSGELGTVAGQVLLDERPFAHWPRRERARHLAVLPQHITLTFPFTVRHVVLMGRTPHIRGAETRHDYDIAEATLTAVDAARFADRTYTTLSGGERQRVQLARVLAQIWEPPATGRRYLLLDEPTASLDLAHQHRLLSTVRQFARQGVGVLMVLHDLNLAAQYGDRLLVLKNGQPWTLGTPPEVLTATMVQAVFDLTALIMVHPRQGIPLVVPVPEDSLDACP
jgi:iron complex transport system ATP-binding protein